MNGITIVLLVGLASGLVTGLVSGLVSGLVGGLVVGLVVGLVGGLLGLGSGPVSDSPPLLSVIQHYVLRSLLYSKGFIPLNYVRFLDYGCHLMIMQRVGGGYRFMHRLLQDYFATMEEEEAAAILADSSESQ